MIIDDKDTGATLYSKVTGAGIELKDTGEDWLDNINQDSLEVRENCYIENFINAKILEKRSLNLGDIANIRNELSNLYKQKGLILKKNAHFESNTFIEKKVPDKKLIGNIIKLDTLC